MKKDTNNNNKVKELIINNSTDGKFYIVGFEKDVFGVWTLKFKIEDVSKPFSIIIRTTP
jgi:hypothetical protein